MNFRPLCYSKLSCEFSRGILKIALGSSLEHTHETAYPRITLWSSWESSLSGGFSSASHPRQTPDQQPPCEAGPRARAASWMQVEAQTSVSKSWGPLLTRVAETLSSLATKKFVQSPTQSAVLMNVSCYKWCAFWLSIDLSRWHNHPGLWVKRIWLFIRFPPSPKRKCCPSTLLHPRNGNTEGVW